MDLEEYWGVGPKTRAVLEASLGTAAAVEAIEAGDLGTLVEAGVDRSRATRILRRAGSEDGMDLLATRDARRVYKSIVDLAAEYAVSRGAESGIRILTPLTDSNRIADRLAAVERGQETWQRLDEPDRERVLAIFEEHDPTGSEPLAAAETAVALRDVGFTNGAFEPIAALDRDRLAAAATALRALGDDRVAAGADEELDRLRDARTAVETMVADATALVGELRSAGVQDTTGFREGLVDHLRTETSIDAARIRGAMPDDAPDAVGFVEETLRSLRDALAEAVDERERTVRETLEADVAAAGEDVDRAGSAVTAIARDLSLGRFADAFDLRRPTYAEEGETLAVEGARNLALVASGEEVQPITYALGEHDLAGPPQGHRVAVLTGANSGGKTTLLETLCQVQILAHMGLPVPALSATVSLRDRIVFHRRHASFNAGVLESTLQSVIPPLVSGDRTLMLVDEFEAITEPGRAADLLHGLVRLTVDEDALGVFVTHLAADLEPLPEAARTDGIVARGLTDDLELEVDYQPRFGDVGRSTPEFIVSRLLATADDPAEQAGFRTLAAAVDTEVVQRTLTDAAWRE
jgi:hypothetical protein